MPYDANVNVSDMPFRVAIALALNKLYRRKTLGIVSGFLVTKAISHHPMYRIQAKSVRHL